MITNLHNPSGVLTEEQDLRAVGDLAARVGARVLVDEVYLDDAVPPHRSAVHLGPNFVITNSLTKVYGLSGLRCGWILAEPGLAERMWRLNDLFGVNRAHPAERLACIAFDHLDEVIGDTPAMLERNRRLFNPFIESRADLQCLPAQHGITAFPRWSGGDTQRLYDHLCDHYDTAVVPGRWFEKPDHFRVGFGLATEDFEEGLKRLGAALDDLK
jgi:aspartate/methionine/tyrosine aminotransferase